jgi:xanthine dehydrogenase YagR molybdenum-binding subunit
MMAKTEIKVGYDGETETVEVDLPEGEPKPWDADAKLSIVGTDVPRIDGHLKVTGQARYTHDIKLPGMLYAAVLRSPLPAATLTKLDLGPAEKMPGVKAVIGLAPEGTRLLFAGQDVAAVAATRPELAKQALRAIVTKYQSRPHVTRTLSAMKPKAPQVHEEEVTERRTEGDEPGTGNDNEARGNVRPQTPMTKGDVKKGFSGAAAVHEATYTTQVHTHSALETHGLMVRWDDDQHMTVWASTQSIFSVQGEMASIYSLPQQNVHVITHFLGGGFGAKFGASAPGTALGKIAGDLAKKTGAPVKLMCDRHEEHVCTGNRPDSHQQVKIAADAKGKLRAIQVTSHGTAGIGTGAGVGRNAFGIYTKCPNILVEASDVFTNAGPGTAMRAPGHPQGAFALELALDELAAKMGEDPLEMRIAHDEHPTRVYQFEKGRELFGWKDKRAESAKMRTGKARMRRGYGVAAAIWGDFGRGKAVRATCGVYPDGTIEIKNGVQDIGGGITTVMAQVAAEVFHRPIDSVRVLIGDSEFGSSVGSGGSQTTSGVAPAVRNACEMVLAELTELAAKQLGGKPSDVQWDGDGTARIGANSFSWKQICKKIDGEAITAIGTRAGTYGAYPAKFMGRNMPQIAGVQFAEVEVDTWTGVVRAERVLALHDCGRPMNTLTLRSQINGGIILGTSYALMEQRIMDHDVGRMLNPNLESYKILGVKDVPKIDIEITPAYTGANSTGAAGIGEPATIPTAAAIGCAVFDALGVPVRSLPLTPDRVLAALGKIPGAGSEERSAG